MRGDEQFQEEMFSYGSLSQRVPLDHPLRRVRVLADEAMRSLEGRFEQMYSRMGRPSVPPEQLLRALLLQMLYTVRSERMLVEQMEYNLLFRWFVGLGMNERVWDATSFTKNRERLLAGEVAQEFFAAVVNSARKLRLLSDERFTVDGTLIEAWASEKSYQPKPGPPPSRGSGSKGEWLKSDTHESKTDPDARLYRKSPKTGFRLHHMAHVVSENEHGLVVATEVTVCSPLQERTAAIRMFRHLTQTMKTKIVAADKGYHERDFVDAMQAMNIDSHVPRYKCRRPCLVDPALYERPDYVQSQRKRKRKWVERFFGWLKTTANLRKTRHQGHPKLRWNFALAAAAYNLIRIAHLTAAN